MMMDDRIEVGIWKGYTEREIYALTVVKLMKYEVPNHYCFISQSSVDNTRQRLISIESMICGHNTQEGNCKLGIKELIKEIAQSFKYWDGSHYFINMIFRIESILYGDDRT